MLDEFHQNVLQLRRQFDQLCQFLVHMEAPQISISTSKEPVPQIPVSPLEELRSRDSMSTLLSEKGSIPMWHDALEFPEEVIISDEPTTPRPGHAELQPSHADSFDSAASFNTADETFSEEGSDSEQVVEDLLSSHEVSNQVARRSILPGKSPTVYRSLCLHWTSSHFWR